MQPEPHEARAGRAARASAAGRFKRDGAVRVLGCWCPVAAQKLRTDVYFDAVLILCGFSNHALTSALARL